MHVVFTIHRIIRLDAQGFLDFENIQLCSKYK